MPVPWSDMQVFDFWRRQNLGFAVFLGDAVYLDTFGVIPPEQAYPQILADPVYSRFFQNTPNFFIYDDHEIINDYDSGPHSHLFNVTMSYWKHYYGQKNPIVDPDCYFFSFTYGDSGFFVLDTRGFRSGNQEADSENKTMLGGKQKAALKEWLLNDKLVWKFILSPVPLTVRLDLKDGWQGYITEREEILDFIEEHEIQGCVFISADSHFSGVYQLRDWAFEYSTSPLQAIPLVQHVYFHPEDHPVLHPTKGYVLRDHQLWASDISYGDAFAFGSVEVNSKALDPWFKLSMMAFNTFGHIDPKPSLVIKKHLSETKPPSKRKPRDWCGTE